MRFSLLGSGADTRIEPFDATLWLDLSLLRVLRKELSAWLVQAGVVGEASDEIVLATHEAAANAIEHARLGTEVTIHVTRDENKVLIVVTNTGGWKQPSSLDETRGRGLTMIRGLMSDLEIRAKSQRTVVRMRKDLSSLQPQTS